MLSDFQLQKHIDLLKSLNLYVEDGEQDLLFCFASGNKLTVVAHMTANCLIYMNSPLRSLLHVTINAISHETLTLWAKLNRSTMNKRVSVSGIFPSSFPVPAMGQH